VLRTSALRVLRPDDLPDVLEVLDRNPVADVFVAARVQSVGLDPRRLGGEMWGHVVDGRLEALCHAAANLVPVQAGPEAARAFADRARRQGRRCASIVGDRAAVATMWAELEPAWGPARDVRDDQPLMVIDGPPAVEPDPLVRRVGIEDLDVLVPACVAMFTEEVGYSPVAADGGTLYRSQVTGLVSAGRSFVRLDDGPGERQVVFKAELGSVTHEAVQVQGVWVNPRFRGRGLAAPGMAAVVDIVRREVAPVVSLYVNGYNTRAVRAYQRVGFTTVGTYATILF
jgi:predicted GNAT family acetyltransferase